MCLFSEGSWFCFKRVFLCMLMMKGDRFLLGNLMHVQMFGNFGCNVGLVRMGFGGNDEKDEVCRSIVVRVRQCWCRPSRRW